jgi:hypothetical protein
MPRGAGHVSAFSEEAPQPQLRLLSLYLARFAEKQKEMSEGPMRGLRP